MVRRSKHVIAFAPEVLRHVDAIDRKYHGVIRKAISEQLSYAPERATRNRRPLAELPGPFGSTWELRCGPDNRFRVFYEVAQRKTVWVLAIAVKERERLFIAGTELEP